MNRRSFFFRLLAVFGLVRSADLATFWGDASKIRLSTEKSWQPFRVIGSDKIEIWERGLVTNVELTGAGELRIISAQANPFL